MTLPKTHPLYGARNVLVDALYFLGIGFNRTEIEGIAEMFIKDLESAGYRVVGPEPTEAQWGGLARAVVMWCQMSGPHTPSSLLKHLERTGETVPDWLLNEPEMAQAGALSKGTIAAIIWRAGVDAAPTITVTETNT